PGSFAGVTVFVGPSLNDVRKVSVRWAGEI
ncbi:MAG: hypothetical protein ACI9VX_001406, partial [Dinoroseobacter sp.]